MSNKRPSFVRRLSSHITGGGPDKEKEEEEKKTDNNNTTDNSVPELFLQEDGLGGPEVLKLIQSNLDRIPDESLVKLTRQLEFWRAQKDLISSKEEFIGLAERLIHAATWRSRLLYDNNHRHDEKETKATKSSTSSSSSFFKVPKVRFGRTELQMPIITCGGMRVQHSWMPDNMPLLSFSKAKVLAGDSQKNLKDVVLCCIQLGLNHFETARMYGTSEIQFIDALVSLMEEGTIQRKDFIFQTKVFPSKTRAEFEKSFQASWSNVKRLGYIDLFSFHVVSKEDDVDRVLDDSPDSGVYAYIKGLQREGKIKHIGFSTHGTAETIMRMVESNKFDYVNIHCHYFGSYHGEGTPDTKGGHGNHACIQKALELDMGIFQISPFDKGGKLYKPSKAVVRAIGPELTPIGFASLYSWKRLGFHTISVGFARVSDLDEVLEAAAIYNKDKVESSEKLLEQAETNLRNLAIEKLGQEWYEKGLLNIPSCLMECTNGVAIGHILWLHNLCQAYGMYEFAFERYKNLEGTAWNDKKSFSENVDKMSSGNCGRGYIASEVDNLKRGVALKDHYDPDMVLTKLAEAHSWLSNKQKKDVLTNQERAAKGWDEAYSLSLWVDFPGDPHTLSASGVFLQSLSGGYLGINNTSSRRSSFANASSLKSSFQQCVALTTDEDDDANNRVSAADS